MGGTFFFFFFLFFLNFTAGGYLSQLVCSDTRRVPEGYALISWTPGSYSPGLSVTSSSPFFSSFKKKKDF